MIAKVAALHPVDALGDPHLRYGVPQFRKPFDEQV
jgi:hypothetical protein